VRAPASLRPFSFRSGIQIHAAGSCLASAGDTQVICSATLEDRVPAWMKGRGRGWLTAEYGMLPGSTHTRVDREAAKGRQQGRTMEIQRLVGRSLRCAVDLQALGERTVAIDCDVLNADGGTRCAAITGAWVALALALRQGGLSSALIRQVAAVSVGIVEGGAARSGLLLDLEYEEDSHAAVDCNLVSARPVGGGETGIVEFQSTGEGRSFTKDEAIHLIELGLEGCSNLMEAQLQSLA
jgi:ribonuclease PH